MKLKILICTMLVLLLGSYVNAGAATVDNIPVELVVNGNYIKTNDIPFVEDGISFVPLKIAAQALGTDAIWDNNTHCITIPVNKSTNIELSTKKGIVYSNNSTREFNGGYRIVNDKAYVPSKLLVSMLGGELSWDSTYRNVVINKSDIQVPAKIINTLYGDKELYWLSRIIHAESSGESFLGKVAVGNVIINRVNSSDFPNSIIDVIFDSKYGIQFSPVATGTIENTPSHESIVAAKQAVRGENVVGESLYFFNPKTSTSSWIKTNRKYFTSIGNHDFYL